MALLVNHKAHDSEKPMILVKWRPLQVPKSVNLSLLTKTSVKVASAKHKGHIILQLATLTLGKIDKYMLGF